MLCFGIPRIASALRDFDVSDSSLSLSVFPSLEHIMWTRRQKQLVFGYDYDCKVDYCTVEVSRDHRKCGGRRSGFKSVEPRCETIVAEEDVSADLSLLYTFGAKALTQQENVVL